MAFDIIPKAAFPNVPKLPGVPALPRSPLFPPVIQAGLGLLEGQLWAAINAGPAWGIFDQNGRQVVIPDSVLDFDFHNDWKVAQFQVQAGGFANYNKVNNPYELSVTMIKGSAGNVLDPGGALAARTAFLSQIENIAGDTNLYSIVTPERTYINANVTKYANHREQTSGAYQLKVEISFIEIRQVTPLYVSTQTANASQPQGVPPANVGRVQPAAPAESTLHQISGKATSFVKGVLG
jgi:hypothetical protein